MERGIGQLIALNHGALLDARGSADEGRRIVARARDLLAAMPPFRSCCVRLLAEADLWDDRSDYAARARAEEAELVAEQLAFDPQERAGWSMFDIDAALNRLEIVDSPVERRTLAEDALATAVSVLSDEQLRMLPGLAREALPSAARAIADAALTGVGDTASARENLAEAVSHLADDPAARAIDALVTAELARASGTGEVDAWRTAVAETERGFVHTRARHYAAYRLAQALAAAGQSGEAADLLERVIADAPGDGAASVARWARALAARAGILLDGADAAAHAVPAASGVSSLTPRELQVLALVAEGLTNPQIGARLFISPKTASVHVSAILAKIGAANRTEAAALYAADKPA